MNIREALRSATKSSHQQLDSVMGELQMFDSADGYRNYLKCMQTMHAETFKSTHRVECAANLPPFQPSLLESIRLDLVSVQSEFSDSNYEEAFVLPTFDDPESPTAQDWGRSYVVEGSAMGGKYMQRIAADKLPAKFGKQYLENLAWSAQHRWPVFAEAIESHQIDEDAAVVAAIEVFDLMHEIVETVLSED